MIKAINKNRCYKRGVSIVNTMSDATKLIQKNKGDEKDFIQWYTDMIENYPNVFIHYLSNDALFQWFGRSARGPDKILNFIRTVLNGTKHIFNNEEHT